MHSRNMPRIPTAGKIVGTVICSAIAVGVWQLLRTAANGDHAFAKAILILIFAMVIINIWMEDR